MGVVSTFVGRGVVDYGPRGIYDPRGVAPRVGGWESPEPPPAPEDLPRRSWWRRLVDGVRQALAVPGVHPAEEVLAFLERDPALPTLEALVVGFYEDPNAVSSWLVEHAADLPALRHLYLGDMDSGECELDWIQQADQTPVLDAFPQLETLYLRGHDGLLVQDGTRHSALRDFQVECTNLQVPFVEAFLTTDLPRLERLELWLGDEAYRYNEVTAEHLRPLFSGKLFPALRHLGLRNASRADALADALATSPLLERLEALDLSLGTLSDDGARSLLAAPALRDLKRLDLRHHYIEDPALIDALRALPFELREEPPEEIEDYDGVRYAAVLE